MAFQKIPDPNNDDAFKGGMLDAKYAKLIADRINRPIVVIMPPGYNHANVLQSDLNIVIDLSKSILPIPDQNPWNVTLINDDGTIKATVYPGYIDGQAPKIGGTAIDYSPAPRLTLTGSGTEVIYLKLTLTLSVANNYVYGADYDSSTIETAASLPADDLAAGEYYIRIATISDGIKISPQPILSNLNFFVEDDGTGTSSAICKIFAS